ncbi:MAG: cadmium resistance transporter [Methanobacterium sp.]
MIDIIIVLTGITAFIATNIDDLFVLMIFFANSSFKNSHIVIGQYIGIISLILISSLGYFFKFIIPTSFISLLGIFPIIIGIKELIKLKRHQKSNGEVSNNKNFKRSSILEVALVSFSNGADNIGIYMPLFASINTYEMQAVITIFLLMIGLWCFIGHSLVNHKLLGDKIKKYGHIIFPFVLIALGIYILLK